MRASLDVDGATHEIVVDRKANTVTVDGETFSVVFERNGAGVVVLVDDQRLHVKLGDGTADIEGTAIAWRVAAMAVGDGPDGAQAAHGARVKPPMNGKLERMLVKVG